MLLSNACFNVLHLVWPFFKVLTEKLYYEKCYLTNCDFKINNAL